MMVCRNFFPGSSLLALSSLYAAWNVLTGGHVEARAACSSCGDGHSGGCFLFATKVDVASGSAAKVTRPTSSPGLLAGFPSCAPDFGRTVTAQQQQSASCVSVLGWESPTTFATEAQLSSRAQPPRAHQTPTIETRRGAAFKCSLAHWPLTAPFCVDDCRADIRAGQR